MAVMSSHEHQRSHRHSDIAAIFYRPAVGQALLVYVPQPILKSPAHKISIPNLNPNPNLSALEAIFFLLYYYLCSTISQSYARQENHIYI
jgi:hypothetical protein